MASMLTLDNTSMKWIDIVGKLQPIINSLLKTYNITGEDSQFLSDLSDWSTVLSQQGTRIVIGYPDVFTLKDVASIKKILQEGILQLTQKKVIIELDIITDYLE